MGDAAGEQPDRLHLLAVMKLVFETLSLRDIARDAQYRATAPAAFVGNIEWNQAGIDPALHNRRAGGERNRDAERHERLQRATRPRQADIDQKRRDREPCPTRR